MTAPPAHPQLAVSASIFRDGNILLVRRARTPAKGAYTLPGGRVEFGEALHDALKREIDEENGRAIDIIGLARGAAARRQWRPLCDHVVRGALARRRGQAQRRARRFPMARSRGARGP